MKIKLPKSKIFTVLMILFTCGMFAATKTYVGPNSGNWNVANNWSPNVIPNATDDIIIPSGKTVTITSIAEANSLSVSGTLTINNNIKLTVYGNVIVTSGANFNAGTGNSDSATILVYGNFTNNGTANFWKSTVIIAGDLFTASTILQNNGDVVVGGNIAGFITGSGTGDVYPVNSNATVNVTGSASVKPVGTLPTDPTLLALMNEVLYGGSCPSFTISNIANVSSCLGSSATFSVSTTAGSPSYKWQVNTNGSGGWVDLTNVSPYSGVFSANLIVSGVTVSMDGYKYRAKITGGSPICTKNGNYGVLTVSTTGPVVPAITSTAATCSATGTSTISNYNASNTYVFNPATSGISINNTGLITGMAIGTSYFVTSRNGSCTSAQSSSFSNAAIMTAAAIPTIITTAATCSTEGTCTISNYNASNTYAFSPAGPLVGALGLVSGMVNGTSYTVTSGNGSCTSVASANFVINLIVTNTYSAGAWSTGSVPSSAEKIVFAGNYTASQNLVGCSCEVQLGTVKFPSGKTLTLTNELKVTGGSLTFEDSASLIQINNVSNFGDITYKRITPGIVTNFDYTYWSSPVSPQTLYGVSPQTLGDKFYSFNGATDNWVQEPSSTLMAKGIGYIIRGPQNFAAPNPPGFYEASFVGVPNNGNVSIAISTSGEASYLLGNPYPSALDADTFLLNNPILDGTLYFWTHSTSIGVGVSNPGSGVYAYSGDDYASYNLTGGVGTDGVAYLKGGVIAINGGVKPLGKIGSGQGFFVTTTNSGSINFTNTMRVGVGLITGDNSQFFKTQSSQKVTVVEKNRLWLDFYNSQGAFKQALIGYVTGATNELDSKYDGETFDGNEYVDFYSINSDRNLVIQGRALPFDKNDKVSLGYRTTIEGDFTIAIDQVDGFFKDQAVFIEDKLLNIIHDLKKSSYTFTTDKGTFDDRFVILYVNNTLTPNDVRLSDKSVSVSNKNKQIIVNSSGEILDKVFIYDFSGKQVYKKTGVDADELIIQGLISGPAARIVKVTLQNGQVITKKIIY